MPRVSVIIPNYNNAPFLASCIESVLAQTVDDMEVIISDDCSTDGSVSIIEHYAKIDSRVKFIRNNKRLNVSMNRHHAIIAASGDYISTLDSDDLYHDARKLEMEISLIDQQLSMHRMNVCAFSNIVIVDMQGSFICHQWPHELVKEGNIFAGIFARKIMIPRDFMFPKSLYLLAGGYDPEFCLYEDWDLKIRLSRTALFYYTGIDGVAYRKRDHGLSSAPPALHVDAIRNIYLKNKDLADPNELLVIKQGLANYLMKLGYADTVL